MLKLKVLIKLLNSRSSVAWQGLCRAAVWFAEGDIWGRRGSVGGKQSREHQSHSPRLDKPSSSGLGNLSCKWVCGHRAALGTAPTQTWTSSDLTRLLPCPGWARGLGKQHIARITCLWSALSLCRRFSSRIAQLQPPFKSSTVRACRPSQTTRVSVLCPQPTLAIPRGPRWQGWLEEGVGRCLWPDLQLPSSFSEGSGTC